MVVEESFLVQEVAYIADCSARKYKIIRNFDLDLPVWDSRMGVRLWGYTDLLNCWISTAAGYTISIV